MRTAISKGLVNRTFRYAAELGLVYFNNPKAGCSTVKFSLWAAIDDLTGRESFAGNVHSRRSDPFVRDVFALKPDEAAKLASASKFSVVRNPFSRVLAAYLDKIPNDPFVWEMFHGSFGLRSDLTKKEFPFDAFLRLIDVAPPELLDGHFRPQSDNLLRPYAKPSLIGYLEDMSPVEQFLADFGVVLRTHVRHSTKSVELLGVYYDADCVELIRKIYAEDFEQFGYSADPGDAKLPGHFASEGWIGNGNVDAINRWIIAGEAPASAVEDLPDLREFSRTRKREHKGAIVRSVLAGDSNLSRLARYAKYARRRLGENELSDAILAKMTSLRTRFERAVGDPSIFLPLHRIIGRP